MTWHEIYKSFFKHFIALKFVFLLTIKTRKNEVRKGKVRWICKYADLFHVHNSVKSYGLDAH